MRCTALPKPHQAPPKTRALSEGSVLCLQDRTLLGRVDDVIGQVTEPLYVVRVMGGGVPPGGATVGADVFVVDKYAQFILPDDLRTKGWVCGIGVVQCMRLRQGEAKESAATMQGRMRTSAVHEGRSFHATPTTPTPCRYDPGDDVEGGDEDKTSSEEEDMGNVLKDVLRSRPNAPKVRRECVGAPHWCSTSHAHQYACTARAPQNCQSHPWCGETINAHFHHPSLLPPPRPLQDAELADAVGVVAGKAMAGVVTLPGVRAAVGTAGCPLSTFLARPSCCRRLLAHPCQVRRVGCGDAWICPCVRRKWRLGRVGGT